MIRVILFVHSTYRRIIFNVLAEYIFYLKKMLIKKYILIIFKDFCIGHHIYFNIQKQMIKTPKNSKN